jgi:hypothetical protein
VRLCDEEMKRSELGIRLKMMDYSNGPLGLLGKCGVVFYRALEQRG